MPLPISGCADRIKMSGKLTGFNIAEKRMIADYRSDTVTRPTPGMLKAMMNAKVGDDVFGEDTSVNELEMLAAEMFGMEAGLFCPSGTMTNQIAIKCHTQPGDEVICDHTAHVYQYEGGGIAFNSGASVKLLQGERGRITARQVEEGINIEDVHKARTSLVCLENTSNRGGGSCYEMEEMKLIRKLCDERNLMLHLDGARLFNAIIANKEKTEDYGKIFHTISICLSKGLGAPVGSVLLGTSAFIKKARRIRKVFGGGMRQAGFLAAAGSFALRHQVERLKEDHVHATMLAEAIQNSPYTKEILPVETNIIIFHLKDHMSSKEWVARMQERGIMGYAIAPQSVRLVVHLDILPEMIERTIEEISSMK